MSQLETTGYYAFGVPLYAGLVAAEWLVARRRGAATLSFAESVGNLSAGLGAIVVGLFVGPALILLYEWGYAHLALVRFRPGSWAPWVLGVVLADFGHYWHHRLDHRVAACWAVHGVHHQPEEMNFTVAMRHAWFSDLYAIPFYALAPLCGVPTPHFFVATTLLSLHALITHTAHFSFPGFLVLVTPRSHILHHARNPRYIDKNFGAMLCVWDRLFGTHVELDEDEPPVYGAHSGYDTHDGALAQWVLWRDLLALCRQAPTLRDKVRVLTARPGWVPPGAVPPAPRRVRRSADIPLAAKIYVAAHFAATVLLSLDIFILRDQHSWPVKAGAGLFLVASLLTLGGVLDGRRAAWRWEAARLVVGAACAWLVL